ncbi:hypothetical protein Pelo_3616 [Pelomyxa schiedti]|nr:hypothetical protein Pelo_3616 [Pelomyxa schiedti]
MSGDATVSGAANGEGAVSVQGNEDCGEYGCHRTEMALPVVSQLISRFGPPWTEAELIVFFYSFSEYGTMGLDLVANELSAQIGAPNIRNEDMVQALYELHKEFLHTPNASSDALIARHAFLCQCALDGAASKIPAGTSLEETSKCDSQIVPLSSVASTSVTDTTVTDHTALHNCQSVLRHFLFPFKSTTSRNHDKIIRNAKQAAQWCVAEYFYSDVDRGYFERPLTPCSPPRRMSSAYMNEQRAEIRAFRHAHVPLVVPPKAEVLFCMPTAILHGVVEIETAPTKLLKVSLLDNPNKYYRIPQSRVHVLPDHFQSKQYFSNEYLPWKGNKTYVSKIQKHWKLAKEKHSPPSFHTENRRYVPRQSKSTAGIARKPRSSKNQSQPTAVVPESSEVTVPWDVICATAYQFLCEKDAVLSELKYLNQQGQLWQKKSGKIVDSFRGWYSWLATRLEEINTCLLPTLSAVSSGVQAKLPQVSNPSSLDEISQLEAKAKILISRAIEDSKYESDRPETAEALKEATYLITVACALNDHAASVGGARNEAEKASLLSHLGQAVDLCLAQAEPSNPQSLKVFQDIQAKVSTLVTMRSLLAAPFFPYLGGSSPWGQMIQADLTFVVSRKVAIMPSSRHHFPACILFIPLFSVDLRGAFTLNKIMSDEGDVTPDRPLPAKRPRVDPKPKLHHHRHRALQCNATTSDGPHCFKPLLNFAVCSRTCLSACERSCMLFRVRASCRTADSTTQWTTTLDDVTEAATPTLGCQLAEGRCSLAFLKHYVDEREWQWKVATSTPESKKSSGMHKKAKSKLEAFISRVRRIMSTTKTTYKQHVRKYDEDNYEVCSSGAIWFPSLDLTKKVFVFCNGKLKQKEIQVAMIALKWDTVVLILVGQHHLDLQRKYWALTTLGIRGFTS